MKGWLTGHASSDSVSGIYSVGSSCEPSPWSEMTAVCKLMAGLFQQSFWRHLPAAVPVVMVLVLRCHQHMSPFLFPSTVDLCQTTPPLRYVLLIGCSRHIVCCNWGGHFLRRIELYVSLFPEFPLFLHRNTHGQHRYKGQSKSFEPEHIKTTIFFTIHISAKRAFFTDSYEFAADMTSLIIKWKRFKASIKTSRVIRHHE